MGLQGAIYEFPNSVPSFEEIFQSVEGKEKGVSMEVICQRERPPMQLTTEERAYVKELLEKHAKRPARNANRPQSMSFAPEFLRISKGPEHLRICRSIDGQKIFIFGEFGVDLFKSVCMAIERLGGSPEKRP